VMGKLDQIEPLKWNPDPSICVVMASEGYPGDYENGRVISGLDRASAVEGVKVFHAGTTLRGDDVVTDGGRVLGVTATGNSISNAKLRAYQAVKEIRWSGAWCRKDISDKALARNV
jgi:phosphoribosylamine---glycine ligase